MNRQTLLAFMVWAIDTDRLGFNVIFNWLKFRETAARVLGNYTDPKDSDLYIPKLVGCNPIKFFTDYVLCYAQMDIRSGYRSYGNLDKQILNYKRS